MIGRKTKGGLVMMSNPLRPPPVRAADACGVAAGEGDAEGCNGDGEGAADGVGVGGGRRVKLAHGLGGTLAQSL